MAPNLRATSAWIACCAVLVIGCASKATPDIGAGPVPVGNPVAAGSRETGALLPIHSERDVRGYLHAVADGTSPFDAFGPVSRLRFIDSLRFREDGLAGCDYSFLIDELTATEIRAVMALFDREAPASVLEEANQRTPEQRAKAAAIASSISKQMKQSLKFRITGCC